jgi:hypothetical protein
MEYENQEVAQAETQPVIIEKVPLPKDDPLYGKEGAEDAAQDEAGIHPDFDYDNPDHPNNNLPVASGQTMAAGSMPLGVLKQFEHDAGKLVTTLEESFHVSAGPVVTRDSLKPVQEVPEPVEVVPEPVFKPASDYAHDPIDG